MQVQSVALLPVAVLATLVGCFDYKEGGAPLGDSPDGATSEVTENVDPDGRATPASVPPDPVPVPTDPGPPPTPVADVEYSLRTAYGSEDTLSVATKGIFAIWWDPKYDHSADTAVMFEHLARIRRECLENYGMEDPPNPGAGYFYNVYIHHGADDLLPAQWANGQGTDRFGMPFLTLPNGMHLDHGNLCHEGFHIFQYEANSPGFEYTGDSQWYVEATAQWYKARTLPDHERTFVEAGTIDSNPHLALWHSFSNHAPGDPTGWLHQVRQYGMHTYLHYLTSRAGVDPEVLHEGFFLGTDLSPQAYLYEQVGGDDLRGHFADFAAHTTGGFDYLSRAQVHRARLEVRAYGDAEHRHPYVATLTDSGTAAAGMRPEPALTPRGWAYNVVRIRNTHAARYTVRLNGDDAGSEGAPSHFEGRIVIMRRGRPVYSELSMVGPQDGSATVSLSSTDCDLFVVVASVPEHFSGNQTYGYVLTIAREPSASTDTPPRVAGVPDSPTVPAGTPQYAVQFLVIKLAKGDFCGVTEHISPEATGEAARLRDGQLDPTEFASLQKTLGAVRFVAARPQPDGTTVLVVQNATGRTVDFTVKRDGERFVVVGLELSGS